VTLRDALDRLRAEGRLTDPGPPPPPPDCTEAAFARAVIALARSLHWKVAHFRPARTAKGWRTPCQADARGWPDLILCRGVGGPPRIIAAELKSARGRLTPEQQVWVAALEAAGVPVYLWRAGDWTTIKEVLS
jgi:hypothetical protein